MTLIDRTDTKKSFYIDVNGLTIRHSPRYNKCVFSAKSGSVIFQMRRQDHYGSRKILDCEDSSFRDDIEQFLGRGRVWVV